MVGAAVGTSTAIVAVGSRSDADSVAVCNSDAGVLASDGTAVGAGVGAIVGVGGGASFAHAVEIAKKVTRPAMTNDRGASP